MATRARPDAGTPNQNGAFLRPLSTVDEEQCCAAACGDNCGPYECGIVRTHDEDQHTTIAIITTCYDPSLSCPDIVHVREGKSIAMNDREMMGECLRAG